MLRARSPEKRDTYSQEKENRPPRPDKRRKILEFRHPHRNHLRNIKKNSRANTKNKAREQNILSGTPCKSDRKKHHKENY